MTWGNTYTSKLTKLRSSQNKLIRSIFFARKKENVTPYYNPLDILKLDNVFQLKSATFVYKILAETNNVPIGRILWHEKSLRKRIPLPGFGHYFETR